MLAYGLNVDFDLDVGPVGRTAIGRADLVVVEGGPDDWSGPTGVRSTRWVDDAVFSVERGRSGDLLMQWGRDGTFHLAGRTLRAHGRQDDRWRRVLLDSALASAALSLGAEAMHAGAVAVGDTAIAVTAATGGGKSTLLAELLAASYPLIADDVLVVDEKLIAHPAPPVMNLPHIRPPGCTPAAALGRVLARLEDEDWLAVRDHDGPRPLAALVVLDRAKRWRTAEIVPMPPAPAPLLALLLQSGAAPERAVARLDRAAAIGRGVSLWQLRAPVDATPPELARLVQEAAGGE